ncbi:hypothetical protein K7432_011638 [Basidiobolus ranarum]|uniref:Arrestin C-terminal-like domain-containing protein n=1 Tax=Basidiobolus ranarum TaxID=34480 RepID=A0ABR2VTM3_9FUNG
MSPKLQIQLEKDTFLKHVLDEDNTFFILKGKLLFTPSSPMKVNQILLRFRGKLINNRGFQSTRKTFFEHQWDFFQDLKSSTVFEAKTYTYDFELAMPADLPVSMDADYAKIEYSIKGMVETPLFSSNLRADKIVHIEQATSPLDSMVYNTLAQGNWNDIIDFEVSIPSHQYTPGSDIPISFKHVSKNDNCKIIDVRAGLCEITTYQNIGSQRNTEAEKVKKWLRTLNTSVNGSADSSSIYLKVPASTKNIHYDADTPYVGVIHRLTTRIEFEMNGEFQTILNVLPIRITRKIDSCETLEAPEFEQLPSYNLVQFDCPPIYLNGSVSDADLVLPPVYFTQPNTIALGA